MSQFKKGQLVPPKQASIETPDGGFKPQTYYRVLVSYSPRNPLYTALFYTGFNQHDTGAPTAAEAEEMLDACSSIFPDETPVYDHKSFKDVYHLQIIKELYSVSLEIGEL